MMENERFEELDKFMESRNCSENHLIAILHFAQKLWGYIPENVQHHIGEKMKISAARVYGVVTFYNYFTLEPKGKYRITVCTGTACYINGAPLILKELERVLKIKEKQVTEDGIFSMETVRCLGACAISPVMMINEKIYSKLKPNMVKKIIDSYRDEMPLESELSSLEKEKRSYCCKCETVSREGGEK